MAVYEHPLKLYTLEHPDEWSVRYDGETGGVVLAGAGEDRETVLSLAPFAMEGEGPAPADQLLRAADRLAVRLEPATVRSEARGARRQAYGEGDRFEGERRRGRYRLWIVRRGPLMLQAAQLGPGALAERSRAAADRVIGTLRFPEPLPPTPGEFRERVLRDLARDYPDLIAGGSEWTLRLRLGATRAPVTLDLAGLYRECLSDPDAAGERIREWIARLGAGDAGEQSPSGHGA